MFHQRLRQLAAIPSHRRSDTLALQMSGRWEPHHGHPWTSISTEKSSKNPTSRLHETRNCGGKVWKADPSRRLHQDALQLHRWENLLAIFKHPRKQCSDLHHLGLDHWKYHQFIKRGNGKSTIYQTSMYSGLSNTNHHLSNTTIYPPFIYSGFPMISHGNNFQHANHPPPPMSEWPTTRPVQIQGPKVLPVDRNLVQQPVACWKSECQMGLAMEVS